MAKTVDKTNIYVLQLEHGCYYVGKSLDIDTRVQQHLDGSGSAWTKKHRPVTQQSPLVETRMGVSPFEEDKVVKEYMAKFGIDKVRGGTYVERVLSPEQMDLLKKEIWSANDLCVRCGRSSHFVKNCYAKTDIYGRRLVEAVAPAMSKKPIDEVTPIVSNDTSRSCMQIFLEMFNCVGGDASSRIRCNTCQNVFDDLPSARAHEPCMGNRDVSFAY